MRRNPVPRVIAITGASAGVGRATAREFARQLPGVSIGLIARGPERLEAARREIEQLGGHALTIVADVADARQVEAAAERIERELGPIDLWVNVAMVSVFSPIKEMTAEEFHRVTEVTYLGYVYGTLSALKRMLPRNRGTIIQVGSALAYRSIPLQSAYCAAKHAIAGFTESLRVELLHDRSRVRVTQVHLPAINTPQFDWTRSRLPRKAQPVPPIFQPEVPARAIVWLARHPERKELWLGYPTVKAILAERIAPRVADWYLSRTGYRAQQVKEPREPGSPENLYSPPPGDPGAHGRFDSRARAGSFEFWLKRNQGWLLVASALALGLGGLSAALARSEGIRPERQPRLGEREYAATL